MTAGQNAGQLRRANTSGMYVAITAVVAGALAIGILATLANVHPAAVTPAAAPIPVPPYEFRLDEHAASNPVSIPVPPYDVRLNEHDLATAAAAGSLIGTALLDRAADNASTTALLDRAADNAAGTSTVTISVSTASQEAWARAQMTAAGQGAATSSVASQEAWARAQMSAAGQGAAAPATKHLHGKPSSNGYSRWGMNAQ
jgi:hypothetical protein